MLSRTARSASVCAAITAAALAGIAPTAAIADAAAASQSCASNALTEPFSALGDTNEYALIPGESADSFNGTGWTLSGGAKVLTTKLSDGTTGDVLQIPSGGAAVSPPMCVTSSYSSLRTMLRNVTGSASLNIAVAFTSNNRTATSTDSIALSGTAWNVSPVMAIGPLSGNAAQQAVFSMSVGGKASEEQVYDLYVDPRMRF